MKIRNVALAKIEKEGKWLVEKGFDSVKNEHYYRFLGGGIEFCELSQDAIRRELKEEINADKVEVGQLLLINEDIFELNGERMHLVEFIYETKIDDHFYLQSEVSQNENGNLLSAHWIEKKRFYEGELIFHPKVFLDKNWN